MQLKLNYYYDEKKIIMVKFVVIFILEGNRTFSCNTFEECLQFKLASVHPIV